ncbi:hypothetical protein AAMO2058_000841600 [Amorphochlora amoebiformis]
MTTPSRHQFRKRGGGRRWELPVVDRMSSASICLCHGILDMSCRISDNPDKIDANRTYYYSQKGYYARKYTVSDVGHKDNIQKGSEYKALDARVDRILKRTILPPTKTKENPYQPRQYTNHLRQAHNQLKYIENHWRMRENEAIRMERVTARLSMYDDRDRKPDLTNHLDIVDHYVYI